MDALVGDHLARRQHGVKHPVHDFLFTYYSFRPAQLRRWSPGVRRPARRWPSNPGLRRGRCTPAATWSTASTRCWSRPPDGRRTSAASGCTSGRWSTGSNEDETRHSAYPLRLGPRGTDEVVETHRIACSHFDAYRFFTAPARPLNILDPAAHDRPAFEQPACLHAGHGPLQARLPARARWSRPSWSPTASSSPATSGSSTCAPRRTTSRTSATTPIRIETPEGKQEYAAAQRGFAERGAPLRQRLIEECERLLAAVG